MTSSSTSMQNNSNSTKLLLAFVGMPGSGKSEAASYLREKGFSYIRFGDVTEEGLRQKNLPVTPESEQQFREEIRKEHGMAAYAVLSKEKISKALSESDNIVIDGLYSWEEYLFLSNEFVMLRVVFVFSDRSIRYARLAERIIRPLTAEQAEKRDIAEIEQLHKSGPFAIADFLIENNADLAALHQKIDRLLERISS